MNTIDGLTKKQVIRNIKKYNSEVLRFASKVGSARNDRTRIKWQRQRARAAGFLTDNQERLARFEAVEQCVQSDGVVCTCQNTDGDKGTWLVCMQCLKPRR